MTMSITPENRHRIVGITVRRLRWLANELAAGHGDIEMVNRLREWARDLEAERGNLIWERRAVIPNRNRRRVSRDTPESELGPDFEADPNARPI